MHYTLKPNTWFSVQTFLSLSKSCNTHFSKLLCSIITPATKVLLGRCSSRTVDIKIMFFVQNRLCGQCVSDTMWNYGNTNFRSVKIYYDIMVITIFKSRYVNELVRLFEEREPEYRARSLSIIVREQIKYFPAQSPCPCVELMR